MYNAGDKAIGPKAFRYYYISGALQCEGHYISMCTKDDKETVHK